MPPDCGVIIPPRKLVRKSKEIRRIICDLSECMLRQRSKGQESRTYAEGVHTIVRAGSRRERDDHVRAM